MSLNAPALPGRRLNRRNADSVRQKIQTTKLIKRLADHVDGKVEMTSTQVDAAKFLVNKSMPNPPEESTVNMNGHTTITVRGV